LRFFSYKDRPVHLGPYPLERLKRTDIMPSLKDVPTHLQISFNRPDAPKSIVNAMAEYQSMLDAIREGLVNKVKAGCPVDSTERANHLKSFGYFSDATMVACCDLSQDMMLDTPYKIGRAHV